MPLTFGEPFPGLIEASASVISIFRLITFLTLATKYGVHSQREERERGGHKGKGRSWRRLTAKKQISSFITQQNITYLFLHNFAVIE